MGGSQLWDDEEQFAEGRRVESLCRRCHQPVWIVYHGPRRNHTLEARLSAEVLRLVRIAEQICGNAEAHDEQWSAEDFRTFEELRAALRPFDQTPPEAS